MKIDALATPPTHIWWCQMLTHLVKSWYGLTGSGMAGEFLVGVLIPGCQDTCNDTMNGNLGSEAPNRLSLKRGMLVVEGKGICD